MVSFTWILEHYCKWQKSAGIWASYNADLPSMFWLLLSVEQQGSHDRICFKCCS
jgi:hypothetical protein